MSRGIHAQMFACTAQFTDSSLTQQEKLYYPLNTLPELLQLMMWVVPGSWVARVHLSTRFESWWKEMHAEGPGPVFGFAPAQQTSEHITGPISGSKV
jgi:hypothetical protein